MGDNKTTQLFKGISIQTVITIVMGVLEIILFAIMSRLLTKSDFGYFAALSGVMAICMSLSEAGLGSAIVQKKNAGKEHISTAFTLSIIIGLLFTIIICFLSPWIANLIADDTLTFPLRLMSINILLHSLISTGNAILYRNLNFKRVGINSIISYLVSGIIGVLMAYNGIGLLAIVIQPILYSLVTLILLYVFSVKIPRFIIYRSEIKGIVSFGGWLTLGVILNNISHQLDKLVLSKWLSVNILGAYNRPAGFISTISSKINSIFDTVLFPMLSGIQENKDKVQSVFIRAVSLLNSFSVILASIFYFNAELIITIFFGHDWLDLVPIMQIVSISVVFNIDGRLVDCFFRSLGLVKLGFYLRCIAVCVTLISLYFGAQYDIIGVAYGLLFANVFVIIIKMIALCLSIRCNLLTMFICWIKAWKPVMPPVVLGISYMFFSHCLLSNIMFALIFGFMIFLEFIVFPKTVGQEYIATVYPMINKVINKFKRR